MADHAILIGICDYPRLGEDDQPANLKGPLNDVAAVKAWLLDPGGGGFPDDSTIHSIISGGPLSGHGARPTVDELEQVLRDIEKLAQVNRKEEKGLWVGERLYLYMAGHGFSPERSQGCLLAADATQGVMNHIHATGWLDWLQKSAFFDEFVLWMDCCMDRMASRPIREPQMTEIDARIPPRAGFIAFAAQRPLKAVENPVPADGGTVHGVFTWALLQGLRGAAADQNGKVTGRSLADWLRNAQSALMTDVQRANSDIALDPEIIQEDIGLIFGRGITPLRYRVTLDFPPEAHGHAASLWSGVPPAARQFLVDGEDQMLTPGLYLVQVPGQGLSQGFEVLGDMIVQVREKGAAIDPPAVGKIFTLAIDPGELSTEIFVIDQRLSLVDRDAGRLSVSLPFGLFKIKTRLGRGISQRVIMLDRDTFSMAPASVTRPLSSVVPLPGTTSSLAEHTFARGQALNDSRRQAAGARNDDAALMLMVRAYSAPDTTLRQSEPWRDVTIVDAKGAVVFDGASEMDVHRESDPYAVGGRTLPAGSYFLRHQLADGTALEQSLLLRKGWRLEVYLLRRGVPGKNRLGARPRVSLMMRKMSQGASTDVTADRLAESMRLALADERHILNAELERKLTQAFDNPVFGLTGAHLMLLEHGRDPYRDMSKLRMIVEQLQPQLGAAHPDWVALALQCPTIAVPQDVVLDGPPLFARSWPLLVRAAHAGCIDIPAVMWSRMEAPIYLPPFMAWSINEDVKRAALQTLRQALAQPSPSGMAMAVRTPMSTPMRTAPSNAPAPRPEALAARAQKWQLPPSALDVIADTQP